MTNLDEYIKKELKKGFSKEEIKETLTKAGWNEDDVVKALEKDYKEEFSQYKVKTKKFWLILATIVIVIILSGAIIYTFPYLNQKSAEECMKKDGFWKIHTCMVKNDLVEGKKEMLKTKCDNFHDDEKNKCYIKLAKDKNEIEFCSKIDIQEMKWECETAPWRNNECEYKALLGEGVKQCFIDLAIEAENIDYCLRKGVYEDCVIAVSQAKDNIEFCNNNNKCIVEFALLKKDINICKKSQLKNKCIEEFNKVN
jgi:hypothetical protein